MTEREALKLALEALEDSEDQLAKPYSTDVRRAITAIKEALAQQCVCGEPNSAGTHRTDGPCLAPQRTWVGLTEEEVEACFHHVDEAGIGLFDFAEAIEAKLKQKNGYAEEKNT